MHQMFVIVTCLGAATAVAQVPDFWPPTSVPTTEARVLSVPSTVERELAQIDVLIEAAAWDEAVDAMLQLVATPSHEVIDLGDGHYVPIPFAAQMRIARWPAEALAVYRKRVDTTAESGYQRGIGEHDLSALHDVASEYRASSWGDNSLMALADAALEAGELSEARGYLLQITPAANAPDGRPWGVALEGLRLDDDAVRQAIVDQVTKPQVAKMANSVYPDTDLKVADVLARLAMVSVRERNYARAEREIAVLRIVFPDAQGIIGGREANLAEAIASTLESARSWPSPPAAKGWPTYGGSVSRGAVAPEIDELYGVVWQCDLAPPEVRLAQPTTELWLNGNQLVQRPIAKPRKSFPYPLVTEEAVLWKDNDRWLAARVADGKPLFGDEGVLDGNKRRSPVEARVGQLARPEVPAAAQPEQLIFRGNLQGGIGMQVQINNGPIVIQGGRAVFGDIRPSLYGHNLGGVPLAMADRELLYVLSDTMPGGAVFSPNAPPPAKRLLALDLSAEGKLRLEIAPEKGTRISGPPVVSGERVYVPERDSTAGGRVAITCYVRTTGRRLWQSPVASIVGENEQSETDLLVYGEGMLFLPTEGGVITAVRAADGQVMWARTYQRGTSTEPNDLTQVTVRERGAYLLTEGALVCAPADAASLFALDPMTGSVLWVNREVWSVEQLLGVVEGRLVATGRQLWLVDPTSGRTQFAWPDNPAADITGSGRGCLAGTEIFWPTENRIYVFDSITAQQSRNPILLDNIGGAGGANLIPCGNGLLVATEKQFTLLGKPKETSKQPKDAKESRLSLRRQRLGYGV